jgi:hypothetical protein
MKNMILITGLAVALGLSTNAATQSTAAQQGAPTVKTGAALKAKAASPAPSDTAKNQSQKTTIGKGKATAKASAPSSYWTEEVDLHDDGSVEAGLWRANEIGFIFSRSVWGRSIASEAVRAIMSRASTRGVTSIIARGPTERAVPSAS